MRITIKFYASLAEFLPADAANNAFEREVDAGTTPHKVLDRCGVPRARAHLLLVNGLYVPPTERDTRVLAEGDVLAAWPPVAGG
jgi:molybdopterin converting factor small subunit